MNKLRIISGIFATFMFFFIYYVSGLQFPPPPPGASLGLKSILYHMSVFFLLAMFLLISVGDVKKIGISLMMVITYAGLDELHQFFVPGRYMSQSDFLIDCVGIAFASLIYFIIVEIDNKK